jgi:hypothetical protein
MRVRDLIEELKLVDPDSRVGVLCRQENQGLTSDWRRKYKDVSLEVVRIDRAHGHYVSVLLKLETPNTPTV